MRNRLFFILLLFLIVVITACSTTSTTQNKETILVEDSVGRTVEVPVEINRIAATYASSGHILALLGQANKIVAVPGGLKRDKLLTTLVPEIKDAVVTKESSKINIEELAKVAPDVIFVNMNTFVDEGEVKKLEKLNIPYLVIHYDSIEEQKHAIEIVGKTINEAAKATEYINFYEEKMSFIAEKINSLSEDEKITLYHSINEATRTGVPGTLSYEWLELVGANNVSNGGDGFRLVDNKHFVSMEQILLWDPDVIIVNEAGVDDYILTNSHWKDLKAVKNSNVLLLPNGLTRWGHPDSFEVPLASLWTATQLYPELFNEVDLKQEVYHYYEKFFSIKLDDQQINDILSAKGMRLSRGEQ